jgi:hypothetical protein
MKGLIMDVGNDIRINVSIGGGKTKAVFKRGFFIWGNSSGLIALELNTGHLRRNIRKRSHGGLWGIIFD